MNTVEHPLLLPTSQGFRIVDVDPKLNLTSTPELSELVSQLRDESVEEEELSEDESSSSGSNDGPFCQWSASDLDDELEPSSSESESDGSVSDTVCASGQLSLSIAVRRSQWIHRHHLS